MTWNTARDPGDTVNSVQRDGDPTGRATRVTFDMALPAASRSGLSTLKPLSLAWTSNTWPLYLPASSRS
ncbi:hypothetical protein D3C81_2198450 [compost metagenome]